MTIHYIPDYLDYRVVIRIFENLGWKRFKRSKIGDVLSKGNISYPVPSKRAKKTKTASLLLVLRKLGTTRGEFLDALCTPRSITK